MLESYHNSKFWWNKEDNVIPRGVAWADGHRFEKTDYDLLFRNTEMVRLVPTGWNILFYTHRLLFLLVLREWC